MHGYCFLSHHLRHSNKVSFGDLCNLWWKLVQFLTLALFVAVEKAALVFCLKFDNGHKLLCLWLDDACDENLAQFPPTRLPVLVDQFKELCSLLVQLRALPVISSAAVQSMRTPRLEQFLQLSLPLEMCNSSLLAAEKATPSNNRYDEVSFKPETCKRVILCQIVLFPLSKLSRRSTYLEVCAIRLREH